MREHGDPDARAAPEGVAAQALRRRLRRHGLAEAVRRPGRRRRWSRRSSTRSWCCARAPQLIGMMGVQMVGPTLIQFGTDEQKQRYLPRILSADEIWCQGYSEPGAGLRSRVAQDARRAGRRRVHRQRPEGVDLERADRRLDVLPRAHRSAGAEAPRHLVHPDRHEDAGHHRAPARCR